MADTLDEPALAALPGRALACLYQLQAAGRYGDTGDLRDHAAWSGLRRPAHPPTTRHLIKHYVRAGGHPDALADRGGLSAERWALGWHRIHAAHWLLGCAVTGIDGPDTDTRHLAVLRRQLTGAVELLGASGACSG